MTVRHTHIVEVNKMIKVTIMDESKPIWKSKTFWVAVLTVLAGVVSYIQGELASGATLTVIGVVNVLLRLVTTNPVFITK